jgi:PKD repeat protein
MRRYFTLCLFFIYQIAFAQLPQVQWAKCFGGSSDDRAYSVIAAHKGGYLLCGVSSSSDGDISFNHGNSDAWIVKTDSLGNIEWEHSYGGSNADLFRSVIATADGAYVACGETASADGDVSSNHGLTDFWVVKIDSTGNILWENTYGGTKDEGANDLAKSDSGFFVAGETFSDDGDITSYKDGGDAWLISIDENGTLIDAKAKGGSKEDFYSAILPSSFGGFLLSGTTFSNNGNVSGLNHGGSDAWLAKISDDAALQWTQCYGGAFNDGSYEAIEDQFGHYILSGVYSTDSLHQDSWFFSVDSSGAELTSANYGGNGTEFGGPVFQNYTNTFVMAPTSASPLSGDLNCHIGNEDIWLYETETDGGINWQQCLGGTSNDRSSASMLTVDSLYLICGYTNSNDVNVSGNHGSYDYWLVKVTPGCSVHANFTYSANGSNVTFTNTSTNDTGWSWTFGDGETSTAENPVHNYPGLGTYNVCLIAKANDCLPDTLCMDISICGQAANAQYNFTVNGSTVTFDNNSTHADASFWMFGDSTTSDLDNPVHTYTANGIYEACLVAIYTGCSTDTLCKEITICAFPAQAAFESSITSNEANFTDTSPSAVSWTWDFGDGLTSTDQNPTHVYGADGTYQVCLTIFDGCASDSSCQVINICTTPDAAFGFSVSGSTVTFVDESEGVVSWLWYFDDGTTSTSPNPSHTYSLGGTYNVCLVATNACGNDTICQDVIIECPPFAGDFNYTQDNATASFTDLSVNAVSWIWDFGDGNTSTDQNPVHVYATEGTYNVCLSVSDGCSTDTICQEIVVVSTANGEALLSSSGIAVYPNPFNESAAISMRLNTAAYVTIYLLDVNQKRLETIADRLFTAGEHELTISGENLAPGIYFLQFKGAGEYKMEKVSIIH